MKRCVKCGYTGDNGDFCPSCGGEMKEDNTSFNQEGTYSDSGQQMYNQPIQRGEITVGDWMLTMLLTSIPCVNIIMLLIWAFGNNTAPTKSNWAKASLIWVVIAMVISIFWFLIIGASMFSFLQNNFTGIQ